MIINTESSTHIQQKINTLVSTITSNQAWLFAMYNMIYVQPRYTSTLFYSRKIHRGIGFFDDYLGETEFDGSAFVSNYVFKKPRGCSKKSRGKSLPFLLVLFYSSYNRNGYQDAGISEPTGTSECHHLVFPCLTSTQTKTLEVYVTLFKVNNCRNDSWNC